MRTLRASLVAFALAGVVVSAQRPPKLAPMKGAPRAVRSLVPGALWRVPAATPIGGTPLTVAKKGRTVVVGDGTRRLATLRKLPGVVKVRRRLGKKSMTFAVAVRRRGEGFEISSQTAWLLKTRSGRAWLVDLDLNGRLERGVDGVLHEATGTVAPFAGDVWFLGGGITVAAEAPHAVTPIKDRRVDRGRALATFNYYRQLAGLRTAALDPEMCEGCDLHARYDVLNKGRGHNRHIEDEKNPHYTEKGARAGRGGLFGHGDMVDSVVANLDIPYHRRHVLHPATGKLGVGLHGNVATLQVNDRSADALGVTWPVIYPAHGQTDVPYAFTDREMPRPVPTSAPRGSLGYPITVIFPRGWKLTETHLEVFPRAPSSRKAKPTALSGYGYGPDRELKQGNSLYAYAYRNNSFICHFISQPPLEPRTRYDVRCRYVLDGKPRTLTWWFETGQRTTSARP